MSVKTQFLFLVFAAMSVTFSSAQERDTPESGITVYAENNFKGQSATYHKATPDLRSSDLNDKISSLKVAPNEKWEVCEYPNYHGRCIVVSGKESELEIMRWSDLISSLRPIRNGALYPYKLPSKSDWYIVLHDEPMFGGSSIQYDGAAANLDSLNKHVQSVTIGDGLWELCEGLNFTGQCITLDQSVPDLHLFGMHNRITSVRPISTLPPEPAVKHDWRIVLYDKIMYRGNTKDFDEAAWNLYGFNGRAQSVVIEKGVWELCEGKQYTGRCITLDKNVPDLRNYEMLNQISSVRPIRLQQR
jgi:hypothetical protein